MEDEPMYPVNELLHRYDNISYNKMMEALDIVLEDDTGDLDYVRWRITQLLRAEQPCP